jgi:sortase (surface protein transpeptidase)
VNRFSSAITRGRGRRGWLHVLALTAAAGGLAAITVASVSQQSAPTPTASSTGMISPPQTGRIQDTRSPAAVGRPTDRPTAVEKASLSVPRSVPVAIDIPAIDVRSRVIPIGKAADGTLAVPQPGPDLDKAAWYVHSVTPGQPGPAVIEGHVDSVYGPSVFYRLGALTLGNTIRVTRKDGSVATFTVNAVRSYPTHQEFPTTAVYGADLAHSTLRLITCGNFDDSTGHYLGNTVVFARLTAVHHVTAG